MSDQKKDLTKIEDLSEYLHEDDPATDAVLKTSNDDLSQTDISIDVDSLDEDSQIIETESFDVEDSVFEEEEESTPNLPPEAFGEDYSPEEDDSFSFKEGESFENLESNSDSESSIFDEESSNDIEGADESLQFNTFDSETEEEEEEETEWDQNSSEDDDDIFGESLNDESSSTDFQMEDEGLEFNPPDTQVEQTETQDIDIFESDNSSTPDSTVTNSEFTKTRQNETISEILISEPITPIDTPFYENESQPSNKPPEKFKDLNDFAKNISYGAVAAGGNPPFSLILKNIKFKEDADDILIILREHKLADDSNEETFKEALQNGSVLISQISEFSAIYLAHKFRRFNLDIQLGLSEELHPSKTYDRNEKGLISKRNIHQNERDSYQYKEHTVNIDNILLATTPTLQNHIISKYLSIVTTHRVVEESELLKNTEEKQQSKSEFDFFDKNEDRILENISFGLDEVYKEMADELKEKCLKTNGNAVVGINFQLTPLFSNSEKKTQVNYKITATGNVVWVLANGEPAEHA